ncbi:hypothetical protein BSL78_14798 [Apostichopus japonicus]|uniref:R3H domain-containing protein n=1 Tax=Stichopus japonicus TaxID=307972 RepID=A0A2G8KK17_STIJA|nr:hypothetical protein BSL78_14798 [Apostichopus japonicus]
MYPKSHSSCSVLIFPPVVSHYRFLIHKFVEDFPELTSFSIGVEDRRRTVVCSVLLRKSIGEEGLPSEKRLKPSGEILLDSSVQCMPSLKETKKMNKDVRVQNTSSPKRNRRSRGRGKRPDQQLYVPRSRRGQDSPLNEPNDEQLSGKTERCSAEPLKEDVRVTDVTGVIASSDERQPGTTPTLSTEIDTSAGPEASTILQASDISDSIQSSVNSSLIVQTTNRDNPSSHSTAEENKHSVQSCAESRTPSNNMGTQGTQDPLLETVIGSSFDSSKANSDSTREDSNSTSLHSENLESEPQGQDLSSRGTLDEDVPMGEDGDSPERMETVDGGDTEVGEAVGSSSSCSSISNRSTNVSSSEQVTSSSDAIPSVALDDAELDESKIKQDGGEVLNQEEEFVPEADSVTDPHLEDTNNRAAGEDDRNDAEKDGGDVGEETASTSISQGNEEEEEDQDQDDDSWDKMFDDSGESLMPDEVQELSAGIKKTNITIKKPKNDYNNYNPKDTFNYSAYDHIIELYDFPSEFKTQDLITSFSAFNTKGVDITWVDDTHALAIFATPMVAQDALSLSNPMLRTRHLSLATKQSKLKAKSCADSLLPHKPRPETSALVARNLVSGALGLKTKVSREQRDMERKRIKEVKEKRREDRRQTEDIWDGKI